MAEKYQEYLAAQVVTEGVIISYRNLSRALKVHVNIAKQMLYEFHRVQNKRRPGSVHATYLICGQRDFVEPEPNGVQSQQDGDDVEMSDPFLSSSMPEPDSQTHTQAEEKVQVTSITLVTQEDLEKVKKQHSRIDAIHVYSLEPSPLQNIQLLSDCTRRVVADTAKEDPLETWNQYGTIHNPKAKRRAGAKPPPPPGPPAAAKPPAQKPVENSKAKATESTEAKIGSDSRPSSSSVDTKKLDTKKAKPPSLRKESSSLFDSFSKAKAKASEKKKAESAKPADEDMNDPSDDEEAALAALPETNKAAKEKADAEKKAKADREAALRDMMDDDENEEARSDANEDAEMKDVAEEAAEPPKADVQSEKPQDEAKVTTTGGRRRGRRRVMKKKTTKDAEGYIVTKEEPVWESFSEAEAPQPSKPKKTAPTPSNTKPSAKKQTGRPGQGNIMNFFGKK